MDEIDHLEIRRFSDRTIQIVIVAELCDQGCGERVRYWNDDAGNGNASCGCCTEGPEACDRIPMRPQIVAMLADAFNEARRL
jgi:hypothetical protein